MISDEVVALVRQRLVHEVHTSERRSFRGCRRRWNWIFQDFYYPKVTAKPLEFGVAFHAAMEVLYTPETWKLPRDIILNSAKETFVETCMSQKANYLDAINQQYITNEELEEDFDNRLHLGLGMLEYYTTQVAPIYDAHLYPLRVEVEFLVPIQNPDTDEYLFCKCKRCQKTQHEYWDQNDQAHLYLRKSDMLGGNTGTWEVCSGNDDFIRRWDGLPVCLAGRIDLLAEDAYGDYWIVDWKTAARLARGDTSGQDRDEFLELDDQIGSYVMALRRKLGLNVRGFIYVELKKAFPEPPVRNKQARLGRMYSVNKQQPVDYDTYLKTVKEDDTEAFEAGLYDEHLEWLKNEGPQFHNRYQVMKSNEELEEIERQLFAEASDMCDPNLRVYPAPGRFSCGFCAFRQPCLETFRQGDPQFLLDELFEKRDKHYWVKESSTDSQGGE